MRSNLFFFVPFYYFIHTRITSYIKFVSWIIIYILPTFFISYNISSFTIGKLTLIYVLQAVIIYTFYEVGYIQNDAETIKKELYPTSRLTIDELVFYEKYKISIYFTRLILGTGLLVYLSTLIAIIEDYLLFSISSLLILAIYQIYNNVRNKFTVVLHFILVLIRYVSYILIYKSFFNNIWIPILIILLFPLINLFERAADKKFDIKFFQYVIPDRSNLNIFRVQYYAIILVIGIFVTWIGIIGYWYLQLCLYYFLYRLISVKAKR